MKLRRAAAATAAMLVAAGWFFVRAPSGSAAGALESGWWWEAESTSGAVPPPPTVPDGGLWVSSNPAGAEALSAIRVPLDPGDSAPVLLLAVHQATPGTLDLAAFPTTSAWSAGPAQAWSSKPAYDSGGVSAKGQVSTDGKGVRFDLSGLVTSDTLNIVIAPAPAASPPPAPLPAPPPSPPTFDVTFERPGASALQVQSAPVLESPVSEQAPAPLPEPDVGSVGETFTPALPTGLLSGPAVPAPAVARPTVSPPVVFRNVPRRLLPVSSHRPFADSAAIAAMLGIVLLWLAREGGPRIGGERRRSRLTIYDSPKAAEAVATSRVGSPPALR